MSFLIYGANGYTGELLAREAVARGHKPILAGRSEAKMRPLAEMLGLSYRCFSLDDPSAVRAGLKDVSLVLHAAGPFVHTGRPMMDACLQVGCHYVDICGEIRVLEELYSLDGKARQRGITLLPGVGFDVVPNDCLALRLVRKIPRARTLEVGFFGESRMSRGTARGTAHHLHEGIWVRRGGRLVPSTPGSRARRIRFIDRERWAVPVPWGDLSIVYRTTGIPDITAYAALPTAVVQVARLAGPLLGITLPLFGTALGQAVASALLIPSVPGPNAGQRVRGRSLFWARVTSDSGEAEAWIDTIEGYSYTAIAGIRAVEGVLTGNLEAGATTPALAFGEDFALQVPGTRRVDSLPPTRTSGLLRRLLPPVPLRNEASEGTSAPH